MDALFCTMSEALAFALGEYNGRLDVDVVQSHVAGAPALDWDGGVLPERHIGIYYHRSGLVGPMLPFRVVRGPGRHFGSLVSVFDEDTLVLCSDTRVLAAIDLFEELACRVGALLSYAGERDAVSAVCIRSILDMR